MQEATLEKLESYGLSGFDLSQEDADWIVDEVDNYKVRKFTVQKTPYENLVDNSNRDLQFVSVTFPITMEDEFFVFSNGVKVLPHSRGVAYFAIVTGIKSDRATLMEMYDLENFQGICDHVNACENRWSGCQYTASILDGYLLATFRNYNQVEHSDLVRIIEEQGLSKYVSGSSFGVDYLDIYISSNANPKELSAYIRIRNGHSGLQSLSFRAVLKYKGFEYQVKHVSDSKKHLGNVDEVVNQLKAVMENTKGLTIISDLNSMTAEDTLSLISGTVKTKRERQLYGALTVKKDIKTATDVIEWLGERATQKGYGTSATRLANRIVNFVDK